MNSVKETHRYLQTCQKSFWRQVFSAECDYLRQHLLPGDKILSVGCGPAIIESGLVEHGFSVVGLDISHEAIACAPDTLQTLVADAENMSFDAARFDVVLFIVSLQFIGNYRQALREAARVLKPDGRVIAMLLNPISDFFKAKQGGGRYLCAPHQAQQYDGVGSCYLRTVRGSGGVFSRYLRRTDFSQP